jgi:2-methylcitrate dehydratase PrpD
MILKSWAENLLQTAYTPDAIELHLMDTLAAFLVGAATADGQALCAFYGRRGDPAELAAGAAAIARASECDDIHLASCVTPGAVVIPVALALARNRTADDFHRAVAAGYAAGLSLGVGIGGAEALGSGVWPTLLAAPLMAAVTASCLAGHDCDRLAHAIALALAGASGRLGRPSGSPSGRWFSLAEAVSKGIRASAAAGQGFRGDLALVSEQWLVAQAGHKNVAMAMFEPPSRAPSVCDVGYKPFPIARQGANAIVALQRIMANGLDPRRIDTIEIFAPALNVALLTRPVQADDRLSRLSNIGYQCACAALAPTMLYDAERRAEPDVPLMDFARRVSVSPATDLEAHLPDHWAARVVIHTGRDRIEETIAGAPFDHDAPRIGRLLGEKWRRLLSAQDSSDFFALAPGSGAAGRAAAWKMMHGRVSMAGGSRQEPEPGQE